MKKKILIIVVIVLIILIIIFGLKFYKIINLMKINMKKSNYSYINEDIFDNDLKLFYKHSKNILIRKSLVNNDYYFIYDYDNKILYSIENELKEYSKRNLRETDTELLNFPFYNFLTFDYSFKNKLKLVFEWKVVNYDNDRYEITTKDNYKVIFDKNTGIALRVTNMNPDKRIDRIIKDFEFDNVTDDDIKIPDFSDYKEG